MINSVAPQKNYLVLSILFVLFISLFPRVVGLENDMLNPDSHHWVKRSLNFVDALSSGDFEQTKQSGHPGVTRMWISGLPMYAYVYFSLWQNNALNMLPKVSTMELHEITRQFPHIILFAKLPSSLLISLFIVLFFLLLRKIFATEIALLASTLIALDPYFVAHSRFIHLDALMTVFMASSFLCFLIYLQGEKKKYLISAGVLSGFALLTKSPSLYIILINLFILVLFTVKHFLDKKQFDLIFLKNQCKKSCLYLFIVIAIFIIFYPAMWTSPWFIFKVTYGRILKSFILGAAGIGGGVEHGLGMFFMGEISPDPGWLFYPLNIIFRLSPVSTIFLLFCFVGFFIKGSLIQQNRLLIAFFFSFIVFFLAQMSLSATKMERYILPIFPFIEILAALGFVSTINQFLRHNDKNIPIYIFSVLFIPLFFSIHLFPLHPNYHSFYNFLLGGPASASKILPIGFGEGLKEAALYLNKKEKAEHLVVTSWYGNEFATYFKGTTKNVRIFDDDYPKYIGQNNVTNDIDYVVLYINQIQRNKLPELIKQFYGIKEPEHVIKINNIEYVWIYKNT